MRILRKMPLSIKSQSCAKPGQENGKIFWPSTSNLGPRGRFDVVEDGKDEDRNPEKERGISHAIQPGRAPCCKGDCLLLHFGSKQDPGLVLIDGGPKSVYKPQLKPRLQQIRAARGLAANDSLLVDLLMVSHVDDDHIQGILELTKDELTAKLAHQPQLLNVLSFWHNSFNELIDNDPAELTASVTNHFGAAAVAGGGLSDKDVELVQEHSSEHPEVVDSSLRVLASIEQGFVLRKNAEGLGYPRNPEFGEKLILARKNGKATEISQGMKFTVVGPMQPELKALHKKHNAWLKLLEKQGKSPPEALAAYVDPSVPNLSSIVVLAEAGGKRILLTGDARGTRSCKACN